VATPNPQRTSLTAHPLLPLLVVLWFGTLFFLSTLVMGGALMARLVLASHIDLVIPGATPPLHATARLLIAALAGLAGAGLGALVARLIAPRDDAAPRATRAAERAEARAAAAAPVETPAPSRRRPLYAYEDLDAEGRFMPVGAVPAPVLPDIAAPAPEPLQHPPLSAPGAYQPAPWSVGMPPRPPRLPDAAPTEASAMILEHAAPEPGWTPAPSPAIAPPVLPADIPAPTPPEDAAAPDARPVAPSPVADAQGGADLLERLAIALERRRHRVEASRAAPTPRGTGNAAANDTQDSRAPAPADTTAALDRALRALRDLD